MRDRSEGSQWVGIGQVLRKADSGTRRQKKEFSNFGNVQNLKILFLSPLRIIIGHECRFDGWLALSNQKLSDVSM
jgi:hypothetical protein